MCYDVICIMNTDHHLLLISWVKVLVIRSAVHFTSLIAVQRYFIHYVILYTRFRSEESDHAPGLRTAHYQAHIMFWFHFLH